MNFRTFAEERRTIMQQWRHHVHQHAELGFQEYETTAYIKQILEAAGISVRPLALKTGVVGVLRGEAGPGPVVALRADIDALPMQEETGLGYASQNTDVMHACGHDGHTAILLGAAQILAGLRQSLRGEIRFLFQPAEELLTGAKAMIAADALEDPPVDYIAGLHCSLTAPVGQVAALAGPLMAAADKFTVTFRAPGAHGAYPHHTGDPILAGCVFNNALQSVVSRQVSALDSAVVSICSFHSGTAFNIIPQEAVMEGTIRTIREQTRRAVEKAIRDKVQGIAAAFQCEGDFQRTPLTPAVENSETMLDYLQQAAAAVLGPGSLEILTHPIMGSEDFAFFGQEVPQSLYFFLGTGHQDRPSPPNHNSHFDFNDDALVPGAAVLCRLAVDLLNTVTTD